MNGDVVVALLEPVVLLDVVEVVASDNDGALHLGRDAHAFEDLTTDADISSERALLVDEVAVFRILGGCEAEANVAKVACLNPLIIMQLTPCSEKSRGENESLTKR